MPLGELAQFVMLLKFGSVGAFANFFPSLDVLEKLWCLCVE